MSYTLPQVNVRLTQIATPGHPADYERPAGDSVVKWTGNVGAYLTESLVANFGGSSGGELNRLRKSTLIIPGDLSPRVDIAFNDIVTYEFQDDATKNWIPATRVIQTYTDKKPPAPALPTTVSLSLVDASV